MVSGKHKSGRYAKTEKRVPGGRTATHYQERTPKQAACSGCGKKLPGIPRFTSTEAKNAPRTQKRPERPYGGQLCSACMRKKIIAEYA